MDFLKQNLAPCLFFGISLGLLGLSIVLADRAELADKPILFVTLGLFYLWSWVVSWQDFGSKQIPLYLTTPVIYLALGWHFLDARQYQAGGLLGLSLGFFMGVMGLCTGLLVTDLLTHFGNFCAKFPPSKQGVLPLWVALPIMLGSLFFPESPVWVFPICLILWRLLLLWGQLKSSILPRLVDRLERLSWLAFLLVIGTLIGGAFYTFNFTEPEALKTIVYVLGVAYLIEETVLILIARPLSQEQEDQPTVIGGGDAMLNAALGAWWGPFALVSSLQIAFFSAFVVIGIVKLRRWISRSAKDSISPEMAFAPFILIGAQLGLVIALYQTFN